MAKKYICPQCGTEHDEDYGFCDACGEYEYLEEVDDEDDDNYFETVNQYTKPKITNSTNDKSGCSIIYLIVGAIAFIYFIYDWFFS